jgi:hypothetical protein
LGGVDPGTSENGPARLAGLIPEVQMFHVLAAFAPFSKETALLFVAAVVCFAVAAFSSPVAGRFPGGSIGLIALGLGLWLWPTMWNTVDLAFR